MFAIHAKLRLQPLKYRPTSAAAVWVWRDDGDGHTAILASLLPRRTDAVRQAETAAVTSRRTRCRCSSGVRSSGTPVVCGVQQPVADVIASHGVQHHQFADDNDTQLRFAISAATTGGGLSILAACTADVRLWYVQNGLQLNPDFGGAHCRNHRSATRCRLCYSLLCRR